MKRHYLYIIIFLLGGLFCSCNGYLEEMPQNKLKPSTIDDYEQLLNKGYISEQVMPYLELLSDDATLYTEFGGHGYTLPADIYMGAYMWYSSHESTMPAGDNAFEKFYNSAYYATLVIENVDQAEGGSAGEDQMTLMQNSLKGEAYALRAYSYFYLVNLYAKPYDPKTCATDPGIPINMTAEIKDQPYLRSSVEEVYAFIEKDLKEAIRLMEEYPIDRGSKLHLNAISSRALLARVYLYMQQWDSAIEQAELVLKENANLFDLSVAYIEDPRINDDALLSQIGWQNPEQLPGTDYLSIDNPNVLFVNGLSENIPVFAKYSMQTAFGVSLDIYNSYKEAGDLRRNYFFRFAMDRMLDKPVKKCLFAKNRYIDYPWEGEISGVNGSTGYSRVIRTEEMYLTLAESYAHKTDGLSKAVEYLNTMRQAKFIREYYVELKASDYTAESFVEKVWLERRLELAFEGHRWFDLRRTTRPPIGEREGYQGAKASLVKDDPRYVLQIPRRELSVNPEIGINPR